MGRGRVQLKKIENKISRQVTFSKRRSGLWKKANEISVLCDAEVALLVFSTKGKLFEFSSHSCMARVLERYEQHTYSQKKVGSPQPKENLFLDYPKLVSRLELLQRNMRNYVGEDLEPLSLREIQSLEHQLDNALKRIRTKKNHLMHESISELQKKEKLLLNQNDALKKKMNEKEKEQQKEKEQEGLVCNIPPGQPTLTIVKISSSRFTQSGVVRSRSIGSELKKTEGITRPIPAPLFRRGSSAMSKDDHILELRQFNKCG